MHVSLSYFGLMSLTRFLVVWCALAILMSANGIFRELALRPAFGPRVAEVLSALLGIALILAATRIGFRPLAGASMLTIVLVAVAFVALTLAFEFTFGHWVDHKSWSELIGNYAIWRGRLWPVVLLSVALAPFLWGRWAQAS